MSQRDNKPALADIRFVKDVAVGGINPNNPISDEARTTQIELLNKCLSDYPRGVLLGSDITIGRYAMGQHELVMQRTVYHVGFTRKPAWLPEQAQTAPLPTGPNVAKEAKHGN